MRDGRSGFTLVELVVVMVIVSVLASLVVPSGLAYIDQKREEQCRLCQKAVLAYYHTATVDLGSGLTLKDYLEDLRDENSLSEKIGKDDPSGIYKNLGENRDSYTLYANNLAAARKQKCPSGGVYKYNSSTKKLECINHGSL
ncbi:MAG: prepilin-type N-terminal cleavage/methylation domain-containing protein [Eubacteriales bacterium]|nr:prepilin-type N-terminal cleavage/methylation domain-containing protein [Eubacteriales bacterium]